MRDPRAVPDQLAPACDCPCHGFRGDDGKGYSYIWDDDRGIRHEDWVDCRCRSACATSDEERQTNA